MPALSVGGVTIPVAPGGISRNRLDGVDRARAFDQTYRASVTGNPKREFQFSTPPVTRALADYYETVLGIVTARNCSGDIIGGSSNLLTWSEDFSNAAWTLANATITPAATTAPDTLLTGQKLVETAVTAGHVVSRQITGLGTSTAQATSVFASAGERTWMMIQTFDKAGAVFRKSWVNLATGVSGVTDGGHTVVITPYVGSFGTWYRITVLWNSAAGGSTPEIAFFAATADNVSSYLGDITKGIYLWGAQHEEAAASTPYVKTTTAAINTLSLSCCSEITGWEPVRVAQGHRVVLGFALYEV